MREALDSLQLSITRQLSELVKPTTVSLALGEPDLALNQAQLALLSDLLKEKITTYSPTDGLLSLRNKLVAKAKSEFNKPELYATVTTGTQQALFMALGALTQPGDRVLLVTPHYPSYEAMFRLYGLEGVFIPRARDGKLPVDAMITALNEMPCPLILLNSPNNPTGSVEGRVELERLYRAIQGTDTTVISDEVYFGFSDQDFCSPFEFPNTVLIRGISKTWGLTGFRLAWLITDSPILSQRVKKFQQNINTCPNTLVQMFVERLLDDDLGRLEALRACWETGRTLVQESCQRAGIAHYPLSGSFYACLFLDNTRFSGRAYDFALDLLHEEDILVVPGKAFGSDDNYFRINCLVAPEKLQNSLLRIFARLR